MQSEAYQQGKVEQVHLLYFMYVSWNFIGQDEGNILL